MAKADGVFIFIGTYPDEASARYDYDLVKDLHAAGAVGTYDAAVITKDEAGKVHVDKDEMATRHGAWGGAAAGAIIGILFPPSIIGTAAGSLQPPDSPACQGRPRRGMNWSRPAATHAIPDTDLLVPQDHPPTRRGADHGSVRLPPAAASCALTA